MLCFDNRFVRRFEREMSISSTDSGVSVTSPYISTPSTPESAFATETTPKQSKYGTETKQRRKKCRI